MKIIRFYKYIKTRFLTDELYKFWTIPRKYFDFCFKEWLLHEMDGLIKKESYKILSRRQKRLEKLQKVLKRTKP
jgi:hypothetical protein